MGQSIKARLCGNEERVIEYTRIWGRDKARRRFAQEFDFSPIGGAFDRWLENETDDPLFGMRPVLGDTGDNSWAEALLDAFLKRITQMEDEIKRLVEDNKHLRTRAEYFRCQQAARIEPKVSELMIKCQT